MAIAPLNSDVRALVRARRAVQCLPFRLNFYRQLEHGSLSSSQLSKHPDRDRLCRDRLSPGRCEDHFIWLIQLGVLRREVDGQGLTERVRLTPLGRDVLAEWTCEIPPAKPWQRLRHWAGRQRPRL